MEKNGYALAAWTENGQLRMVPSLVNEAAIPYRKKIDRLANDWNVDRTDAQEIGWLLAQSHAHEEYALFLLRVGCAKEAYEEYSNAAQVCLYCSDRLWLQGTRGDFPVLPLYHRFHAMHRKAWELTRNDPSLQFQYENGGLKGLYLWMTIDERDDDAEFEQILEYKRAWRFGRTA